MPVAFRPVLAPGAHLTRHDGHRLRIGNHPGIIVADTDLIRAIITAIDGVRTDDHVCRIAARTAGVDLTRTRDALSDLIECGAVIDGTAWARLPLPRDEVIAAVLRGQDPGRARGRAGTIVNIHASPGCSDHAELIQLAAQIGGLQVSDTGHPHLHVLVLVGEPCRQTVESLLISSRAAVLPVVFADGRVVIGPWSIAGHTPCLRCADSARAAWQPGWGGPWPSLDRADRPHGVGVELAQHCAAFIIRDILTACDGGRPHTVGSRFTFGPEPQHMTGLPVSFDPTCSCQLLSPRAPDTAVS